jgi:DnaJ-class molecular chaperone
MEDYYRLLNIHYEASIEELNSAYKNKLIHFKSLPFLTENDQEELKKLKKANAIFNNPEYKKTYDQYLQNKFKKEVVTFEDTINNRKKNLQNSNYMVDRIFGFNSNNVASINLKHNELLRPKNVGLSSDILPEFDKPLDYSETNTSNTKEFLPYNFDS